MVNIPSGEFYDVEMVEIDWDKISTAIYTETESTLVVVQFEDGFTLVYFSALNPNIMIANLLATVDIEIVERFDLAGSIQLVVR